MGINFSHHLPPLHHLSLLDNLLRILPQTRHLHNPPKIPQPPPNLHPETRPPQFYPPRTSNPRHLYHNLHLRTPQNPHLRQLHPICLENNPQIPLRSLKNPVVLLNGLLDTSFTWFTLRDPKKCFPFLLADEGFPVWALNNRGTKFSLGHEINIEIIMLKMHIRFIRMLWMKNCIGTLDLMSM